MSKNLYVIMEQSYFPPGKVTLMQVCHNGKVFTNRKEAELRCSTYAPFVSESMVITFHVMLLKPYLVVKRIPA